MPMNEAMVANLSAEELAHYARIDPSTVEKFGRERFVDQMAEEVLDLQGEVAGLEQDIEEYNDCHILNYPLWQDAQTEVIAVLRDLQKYAEDLDDDHPLAKLCIRLDGARQKVSSLIHG